MISTFWEIEELMITIMGKTPCFMHPQIQNLCPHIAHHTCRLDGDWEGMNF